MEHAISSYEKYGKKIAYIALCRFLYKKIQDDIKMKLIAKSYKHYVLFDEKISTDCSEKDKYGMCRLHIVNENKDILFYTRDPNFGKKW